MNILEGLNPEQRAAAEHDTGPMLVVAGAGTGKTQVITKRIAYLIAARQIPPSNILALTFTDRAAREMEDRLYELIGWQSFQVGVMTFHAYGQELMSRFAHHIDRNIRGGLLTDTQKVLLLLQHIDEIELEYYDPNRSMYNFLEHVIAYIERLQNAAVSPARYAAYVSGLQLQNSPIHAGDLAQQGDLLKIFELYESLKVQTGTYDYYDQMSVPLEILQAKTNIAERLRREHRYVLVDEYQDTNPAQDQLLRAIVGSAGNIFAVGDDDQAIYGFRGADIANILSFSDHYALQRPIALIQNYRSGQPILDAAYRLIRHNDPERLEVKLGLDKRLLGLHGEASVEYCSYESNLHEQQSVVAAIEAAIEAGESPQSLAVLCSTHAPLKAIAKHMRARGIAFNLAARLSLFEQPEMLSLWYLANWIAGKADEQAISHTLLGPYFAWPHATYQAVVLAGDNQAQEGIEHLLRGSTHPNAVEAIKLIDLMRERMVKDSAGKCVYSLVFETSVGEAWRLQAVDSSRMIRVFEDLSTWLEHLQEFDQISEDQTLGRYLEVFPKPPEIASTTTLGDPDGVSLLTVHASKGLEFETVFLINCVQRSWSTRLHAGYQMPTELMESSIHAPEHEFRRLFYVAITRAKHKIVVSFATKTASGNRQMISPFVGETFGETFKLLESEPKKSSIDVLSLHKIHQLYPLKQTATLIRMPYERSDGWIELGVTALAEYEYCPFEFFTNHGLGLRSPAGAQMSFGITLHAMFEQYYRLKSQNELLDMPAWHARLDEQWTGLGYERPELASRDLLLAHQVLETFILREERLGRRPIGVELPIRFDLPEFKLKIKGKVDAIFQEASGVSIRDYKTGRSKTNLEKLHAAAKDNFQLRTYALAYGLLQDQPVFEVVLDYVVTGLEGVASYSPTILKNHRTKLGALADRIRAHDFAPNPSAMHECAATKYYGTGEQDDALIMSLKEHGLESA